MSDQSDPLEDRSVPASPFDAIMKQAIAEIREDLISDRYGPSLFFEMTRPVKERDSRPVYGPMGVQHREVYRSLEDYLIVYYDWGNRRFDFSTPYDDYAFLEPDEVDDLIAALTAFRDRTLHR